ncbi:hypothetical protein S1001342_00868 [Acetobacter pasteurianus subsp. pasteurianus]|uniref:Uncharacterized protein n=1 Tax=Acetobacter pasteurianus subsp. pasteurianus TaxID=481145 RepID=A0A1Y0XWD6_ACEPA|nr:hypothetical protein S1001342_00868 [Acetobacter pasteurianus subsp. pasteurianus]
MKDLLPGRDGRSGGVVADNRLFVEAELYHCRVRRSVT